MSELRVFEVDHPATQAWKRAAARRQRASRNPATSPSCRWISSGSPLAERLARAGFASGLPSFFSWLGRRRPT